MSDGTVMPKAEDVARVIAMIDPLDAHAPRNVDAKCIAPLCGETCWPHRFFCKEHRALHVPVAMRRVEKTTRAAFELILAYEAYRTELCDEAAYADESKITRDETGEISSGIIVTSTALDKLWERVEAARAKLIEAAR